MDLQVKKHATSGKSLRLSFCNYSTYSEPCAACGLDNKSDECETYAASGYCHNQHFAQFMMENCPRTCCVYTGNYSFV